MAAVALLAVVEARFGDSGQEKFEIIRRADAVGVFLCDGFALFGDAESGVERAVWLRADEAVGRPSAAADAAAASVEKENIDAMLSSRFDQALLGAVEAPEARDDAAILVAVAVADHHLLRRFFSFVQLLLQRDAAARDRMREEAVENLVAAFEVIDGFEERHHRNRAGVAVAVRHHQTDLAGEEVDDEQVGDIARHADNQRTDAVGAELAVVVENDPIAGERGFRLRPGVHVGVGEGARREQFTFEELKPRFFAPFREALAVEPRRRHELRKGEVVEAAVLADVESAEVEAEGLRDAVDRRDVAERDVPRVDGRERSHQQLQVGEQLGVAAIAVAPELRRAVRSRRLCARQGFDHEVDELPPRLVQVSLEGKRPFGAEFVAQHLHALLHRARGGLEAAREAEFRGEPFEFAAHQRERVVAHLAERLLRGRGGHERMAVAVAPDPAPEAEARQVARIGGGGGIESGHGPRFFEAVVENGHDVREDRVQVVQYILPLGTYFGFLKQNFAGAPEPFEHHLDVGADFVALGGRPHAVLALDQEEVEFAVLFEHGAALGFGRVRREGRLDLDFGQLRRDLGFGDAEAFQVAERFAPEATERLDPLHRFEAAAILRGGVLLGHVQKLKDNRPRLDGTLRLAEIIDRGFVVAADVAGERILTEIFQHLDEAVEQVAEIERGFVEIDDAGRGSDHGFGTSG